MYEIDAFKTWRKGNKCPSNENLEFSMLFSMLPNLAIKK